MRFIRRSLLTVLLIAPIHRMAAQIGFEALIKDINDINVFYTC